MSLLLKTVVFIVLLVPEITAVKSDNETSKCFTRLEKETIIGDSLTVFTTDSSVIHGHKPIINFTSSVLYMKLLPDSSTTGDILLSFETIDRITFVKPDNARHALTILGLGAGIFAGAMIGGKLHSEPNGWFSDVASQFLGGLIGGVIGAILGHEIGKNMTSKVTLNCK